MRILEKKIDLGTYLDLRRVKKFSKNKPIRMIVGSRGDGKSTSIKKWLSKEIYKNQRKFVWLCRTEDEIKVKKNDIFEEEYPNWKVIGNKVFDIVKKDMMLKNGIKKTKVIDQYLVGMIIPINLSSKYRSGNSFKDYDIVIWDEFQDENNKYLSNEMNKLFSILETVLRTKKNADIWLISNEVSKWCPLYDYINLKDHPKPGQIAFFDDLKIAYYRTKTSEELKKLKQESIVSSFSKKSDYKKFAYDNEWKEDNDSNILTEVKTKKEKFNIIWVNNKIGIYDFERGIYLSDQLNSGKTYPMTKADAIENGLEFTGNDWFINILNASLNRNCVYYSNGILKELIKKMIKN